MAAPRRRVTGFSPRFFVIIAVLLMLLGSAFYVLKPEPEPVYDASLCPAFALDTTTSLINCGQVNPNAHAGDTLRDLGEDWGRNYESAGVTRATSVAQFTGDNYVPSIGKMFRMRVYVPAAGAVQDRPDLARRTRGWTFLPAVVIPAEQTTTLTGLAELSAQVFQGSAEQTDRPLMLGFRDADLPSIGPEGAAFEVDSLLWWRSDQFSPAAAQGGTTGTVWLVDSRKVISETELAAPTTHRAPLNLVLQENGQELVLHDVEWSTVSNQTRVCATLTNTGIDPVPVWSGFGGMSITEEGRGAVTGTPDPSAGFASAESATRGNPLVGYIDFAGADPSRAITFSFPGLSNTSVGSSLDAPTNSFQVTVPQDKIKVAASAGMTSSPCTGVAVSAG